MSLNPSNLIRQPVFWVGCLVLAIVLVLAFWYVKRPTDANGESLILSRKEEKEIRQDLGRQAARRARDSVQTARADSSATALYRQGQQNELNATRLHQQTHEKRSPADTSARRLQQLLSEY